MSYESRLPKPYSPAEELEVARRVVAGDREAREALIAHNLRLVIRLATLHRSTGIDMDDMVSLGNYAVVRAVDTFDPNCGIKFSTYAGRCITNEILMELRKQNKHRRDVPIEAVLGRSKDGGEALTLADVLPVPDDTAVRVEREADRRAVLTALDVLPEQQRYIICHRFGLVGARRTTQREIARRLHCAQASVSRYEQRALRQLRIEIERRERLGIGLASEGI